MLQRAARLIAILAGVGAGLSGCGDPTFEVSVPFAAVYVTPNDGTVVTPEASAGLSLFAAFNAELDAGSVGRVALLRGETPIAIETTVSGNELSVGHGVLTEGEYVFLLPSELASSEGTTLGTDVRVGFSVRAD